jgi:hypothetical protein
VLWVWRWASCEGAGGFVSLLFWDMWLFWWCAGLVCVFAYTAPMNATWVPMYAYVGLSQGSRGHWMAVIGNRTREGSKVCSYRVLPWDAKSTVRRLRCMPGGPSRKRQAERWTFDSRHLVTFASGFSHGDKVDEAWTSHLNLVPRCGMLGGLISPSLYSVMCFWGNTFTIWRRRSQTNWIKLCGVTI